MKSIILVLLICISMIANAQEKQVDNFKKTDEVLAEIVKKALVVAEKTGNFAIEQAPILLQEFYRWHIANTSINLFFSLISTVIFLFLRNKHKKNIQDKDLDVSHPEILFPRILILVGLFISIVFFIGAISDLCFILIAPKLYLIEYFVN